MSYRVKKKDKNFLKVVHKCNSPKNVPIKAKVTQNIEPCVLKGITAFLQDLGLTLEQIVKIGIKLEQSYKVYQENLPEETLSDIASLLYQCLKTNAINAKNQLLYIIGRTIIILIIMLMIYIFILMLGYSLFFNSDGIVYFFLFWLIISLTFLGLFYLIYLKTAEEADNIITSSENSITECVNVAIVNIQSFLAQERLALQKAICSY